MQMRFIGILAKAVLSCTCRVVIWFLSGLHKAADFWTTSILNLFGALCSAHLLVCSPLLTPSLALLAPLTYFFMLGNM